MTDNRLNQDGIWVRWSADDQGMPANAVHSGPYYVIRATHYHDGDSFRGKIPGKYRPGDGYATYPYYNKEYKTNNFEVLTHTNWIWQNKVGQPNYLIPGGHDSDGNPIWISQVDDIPGKLHNGECFIGRDGKEERYTDWATLKRKDNSL